MNDADWLATFLQVVTLRGGYNTIVVMIGVSLLGVAAGAIGAFALLRKRAMMSDVLSHATLPGIGVAFLVAVALVHSFPTRRSSDHRKSVV